MLDPNKVKLAIAPIGWTNDDMPDLGKENTFEQCVSEMALAGFKGSEIGNKYPQDVAVLKHKLDVRGPYEVTIRNFIAHRDRLHALGAKVIGASEQGNSIQGKDINIFGDQKPVYTPEQWELIARGYNEMGALAQEKGMTLTCHHHMGTGVQTAEEIDTFMSVVDPERCSCSLTAAI